MKKDSKHTKESIEKMKIRDSEINDKNWKEVCLKKIKQ